MILHVSPCNVLSTLCVFLDQTKRRRRHAFWNTIRGGGNRSPLLHLSCGPLSRPSHPTHSAFPSPHPPHRPAQHDTHTCTYHTPHTHVHVFLRITRGPIVRHCNSDHPTRSRVVPAGAYGPGEAHKSNLLNRLQYISGSDLKTRVSRIPPSSPLLPPLTPPPLPPPPLASCPFFWIGRYVHMCYLCLHLSFYKVVFICICINMLYMYMWCLTLVISIASNFKQSYICIIIC